MGGQKGWGGGLYRRGPSLLFNRVGHSAAVRGHEGIPRRRQPRPALQTHAEHGADAPQRRPELPPGESPPPGPVRTV